MADEAPTYAGAWDKTQDRYFDVTRQLTLAEGEAVDRLERELAAIEDELLDLPAPSFAAVRTKLEFVWSLDIDKPDRDGAIKAQIIEDIDALITMTEGLMNGRRPEPAVD